MGASHTEASAFWIFKEADEWLGFSPMMTQALEEAYQTWLQEEAGGAILPVDLRYLADFVQDGHPAQRICRVSRESLTVKEQGPSLHLQLNDLKEQVRHLEAQLSKLQREAEAKPWEAAEPEPLLEALQNSLWPGRLVRWKMPDTEGEISLTGRVICTSDDWVAVAFADLEDAVWLLREDLQGDCHAELISRAGSKVYWHGGDSHGQKAVVLSHSEHPAMVHVQTEGGNISKAAIQDLTLRHSAVPELGDLLGSQTGWGRLGGKLCVDRYASHQWW